jgi:hypothetical protein
LSTDGFRDERKPRVRAESSPQIDSATGLWFHGHHVGAIVQKRPSAIADMSADVKAQVAGVNELPVKSAQPTPVEGFPEVNQHGSKQAEAAFQTIHCWPHWEVF